MLHALGAALAAHVRLEERELFEIIERAMPADELLELARRLDAADADGDPGDPGDAGGRATGVGAGAH